MNKLFIDGELIKLGDEHLEESSRIKRPTEFLTESHLDAPGNIRGVHYHDPDAPATCRCPDCTYTFLKGPDHVKFTKYILTSEIVKDMAYSNAFCQDFLTVIHSEIEDARYNGDYMTLKSLINALFSVLPRRIRTVLNKADTNSNTFSATELENLRYVYNSVVGLSKTDYASFDGSPYANKEVTLYNYREGLK